MASFRCSTDPCARVHAPRSQPCITKTLIAAPVTSSRNVHQLGYIPGSRSSPIVRSLDYVATSSDEGVLRQPRMTPLAPEMITNVYGFHRNILDKYFLGKVIGRGSFGVVQECIESSTGARFAVKKISKTPKGGPTTPRYLLKLRAEVEIMQQLGNSLDAVNLQDVFEDDTSIYMVMELCEGGELMERFKVSTYSEAYIAGIVRGILRFISQCHSKGFIYRDVKPDNFLFLTKAPDSYLKATDFGLAIHHTSNEPKLTTRSGTPAYMAPELILQNYDEKCDLWSVGMMTYQMLTGRFPYWDDVRMFTLNEVWRSILTEEINWSAQELENLSEPCKDFLKGLLERKPEARMSAIQALQHPWLTEKGVAPALPLGGSVVQRLQRFSTFGRLKQMVLKMMFDDMIKDRNAALAENRQHQLVTPERNQFVQAVEDLFKDIDTDSSGAIDLKELTTGLQRHGYVLSDDEVRQLSSKIDINRSGDIDKDELLMTLVDWGRLQEEETIWMEYLDRAFAELDLDGNGSISLNEIQHQIATLGMEPMQSDADMMITARQMLREADTDGDGQISKEEFYTLLRQGAAQDALCLYDDRVSPMPKSAAGAAPAS